MISDPSIDSWSSIDAAAARAVSRRPGVPSRWVVATVRQSAEAATFLGNAIEQLAADDAPAPVARSTVRDRLGAIDPALILLPMIVLTLFASVTVILMALQRAVAFS
jgi:hypothetical protein